MCYVHTPVSLISILLLSALPKKVSTPLNLTQFKLACKTRS